MSNNSKPVNEMSIQELLASADRIDLDRHRAEENERRVAMGVAPLRDPSAPRYSDEQILEVNTRIAADQARAEAHARDPLPDDLKGKSAMDMSPVELARAHKAMGISTDDWSTIQAAQIRWNAGYRD